MKFVLDSPAVKVGDIHLVGVSDDALSNDIARSARQINSDYDARRSAASIEDAVTAAYRDRGYAEVRAHAGPSGKPVVGDGAIRVPFEVRVEEGHVYKLGSLRS